MDTERTHAGASLLTSATAFRDSLIQCDRESCHADKCADPHVTQYRHAREMKLSTRIRPTLTAGGVAEATTQEDTGAGPGTSRVPVHGRVLSCSRLPAVCLS